MKTNWTLLQKQMQSLVKQGEDFVTNMKKYVKLENILYPDEAVQKEEKKEPSRDV